MGNALNLLPAILIGGPPHSGKSVLAYSLSQALRKRNLAHYLLRAAPDGEGDWAQEMAWEHVQAIRFKGEWDAHWVQVVCRDIAARTLPLLVDVGGRPREDQLAIFDQCTDAILLTPDEASAREWRALVTQHGLPVLADLRSTLTDTDALLASEGGELRGVISGLQRGAIAQGPTFAALVERIARLFHFSHDEITHAHLARKPEGVEVVRFDLLVQDAQLAEKSRFRFDQLEAILARVPTGVPIATYGRIPAWLATALGARRDLRWQFDARLGWVRTPHFVMAQVGEQLPALQAGLRFTLKQNNAQSFHLDVSRAEYYLDYSAMEDVRVPFVPPTAHLTINGPDTRAGGLPLWVFAALGRAYRHCAEVRTQNASTPPSRT